MAVRKNNNNNEKKTNVYQIVTNRILDSMMKGVIPWRNTYVKRKGEKARFVNFVTQKPYSFLNCLLLGEPGEYISFKQVEEKHGHIKKGAKSRMVIYWGEYIPKEYKDKAKELEEEGKSFEHLKVRFPKYYLVFNMNDVEGINRQTEEMPQMQAAEDPTNVARMVVSDYKINEQVNVETAPDYDPEYNLQEDRVLIPEKENYTYEEDWWASLFSGLVHSTMTEKRCNRETEQKKMLEGEMSVKEELIGEIGSSMILSICGLHRKETHEQINAVCQKWIEAMNKDYRLIVSASYAAEKAAKYVMGEFAE